jgi:hypothetical protein
VRVGVPVTTANFALELSKPFTVSGQVTNMQGTSIAGAFVGFVPSGGYTAPVTDTSGHYSITGDTFWYGYAAMEMVAVTAGFLPAFVTISVSSGANISTNFVLEVTHPFTIEGNVSGPNGPIAHAVVQAVPTAYDTGVGPVPPNQAYSVHTDAAGNYSMTVNPGAYSWGYDLNAGAAGYVGGEVFNLLQPAGATTIVNFSLTVWTSPGPYRPSGTGGGGGHNRE